MKTLHSDNIVSFVDVMESTNNYYIVQELCSGDLEGYLKGKPGRCVDEGEAIKLLTEICNGFLTLVKEGIVHR
jgi:serine/threonine protein kinase